MANTLIWKCECGSVEASLPDDGVRIVCYCASCREHAVRLGKEDRIDQWGGSDLMQVDPHKTQFIKGVDQLRWFRVTEKGPLRWYAACCNTPMANTLPTRALPFASFQVHDTTPKDGLPQIKTRVNLKGATGRVEGKTGGILGLVGTFVGRAVKSRFTGTWKVNPFFDDAGKPIAARQEPGTS